MSFTYIAVCDACGVQSPVPDEGELPQHWYAVLLKEDRADTVLAIFDSMACMSGWTQARLTAESELTNA